MIILTAVSMSPFVGSNSIPSGCYYNYTAHNYMTAVINSSQNKPDVKCMASKLFVNLQQL